MFLRLASLWVLLLGLLCGTSGCLSTTAADDDDDSTAADDDDSTAADDDDSAAADDDDDSAAAGDDDDSAGGGGDQPVIDGDGDGVPAVADCDDDDPNSTTLSVDGDCDGVLTAEDCDDRDMTAVAIVDDRDCDGTLNDADCGPDDAQSTVVADDADCDGSISSLDCNELDASVHPGAVEQCNGVDDDCDPQVEAAGGESDQDNDGSIGCEDCDDGDAANTPGGVEVCDGQDNDCDSTSYFVSPTGGVGDGGDELSDSDADGSIDCLDCDDANPDNFPGNAELCDGADNDCDAQTHYSSPAGSAGDGGDELSDSDADGSIDCLDCEDANPDNFPGNTEVCDGLDNDCDGALGANETDDDGDNQSECQGDCDDNPNSGAQTYPGAPELCDGLDNDCDGQLSELLDPMAGHDLTTTFDTDNGSKGNIFEVEVLQDLAITSFDGHLGWSGSGTVDVYWKLGTAAGSNTTLGDWTFQESVVVPAGQATGTPTPVPLTTPLELSAGETYSIFFYSSLGIDYTTGTSLSTVAAQDSNLIIYEGYGCNSISPLNCIYTPRVWNGTIHYLLGSTEDDSDQDGFLACDSYVGPDPNLAGGDCNDDTALASPGVIESLFSGNCSDGLDNDCDGAFDQADFSCQLINPPPIIPPLGL